MHPVVVVGAGISGIGCARALAAAGLPVRVLDRAGEPGGRMATAEHAGRPVDVGASYFTVSDARFADVVRDWQRRGLARPWTDTFDVHRPAAPTERTTGPLRWAAGAGLCSLVADLAGDLPVERVDVDLVAAGPAGLTVAGQPAVAVVLAMPDPQARAVLHPALARERAGLYTRFEPVLALAAGWPRRDWKPLDGMFVHGDERLSWIADDGSRRGDGAPVLVAHSTPSWAAGRADQPEQAGAELLQALRRVLGIATEPSWTALYRWDCAKPASGRAAGFQLWPSRIAACGDGWTQRPRVEAAFLSGVRLGTALASRLTDRTA
ncbi:NAD(P)/FAD-dependent oxidoreductase [Jatrophihabitans sp.]|uniref:NAD(P)/FAD-dependent oxidoreductase n=1 Tax=Jatrophihabitans sp. TaxID=1932789 RepID=UPI002CA33F75|nr:FAD-dependent oxidoreductase [Jatrophihabitans sp.]